MLSLILALPLAGCNAPGVSGRVLPSASDQRSVPWQRVQVTLLRGKLTETLSQLATRQRQAAHLDGYRRVIASAQAERARVGPALQRAREGVRAALGDLSFPGPMGAAAARTCDFAVEARLATARYDYETWVRQLTPRLVAAGMSLGSPDVLLAQLRAVLDAKIAAEAWRLHDEYLHTNLAEHSGAVLSSDVAMDRLCWRAHNRGNVAVQFRGLTVLYDNAALPYEDAARIWALPPPGAPLHIPDTRDILLPGAGFETCFFARHTPLPPNLVARYGFSPNPSRSGQWHVQWHLTRLVDSTAVTGGMPDADPHPAVLFAERLDALVAAADETALLDALTNAEAAVALRQTETAAAACRDLLALEAQYEETERVIAAIEAGTFDEPAVDVRLQSLVQRLLREPGRLAQWIEQAGDFVSTRTVAQQEHPPGAAYAFADLEPGEYTLLAGPAPPTTGSKLWLIPLDVTGHLTQDLIAAAARDQSLQQLFETIWLNGTDP